MCCSTTSNHYGTFKASGKRGPPLIRMILQIIADIFWLIVLLSILLLGSTITYYTLTDGGRQITDPDLVEPGVNGWMSQLVMLGYYMYQALLLGCTLGPSTIKI